jgi:hypothetical protein
MATVKRIKYRKVEGPSLTDPITGNTIIPNYPTLMQIALLEAVNETNRLLVTLINQKEVQ